jgi:putative endonuclease
MFKTNLPFSLYVIKSQEGKFYIGISSDVDKRIVAHNSGLSNWTKKYKSWKLVYKEDFENYKEARKREVYLKSMKGGNGFYKIIYSGVEQSGSSRGS